MLVMNTVSIVSIASENESDSRIVLVSIVMSVPSRFMSVLRWMMIWGAGIFVCNFSCWVIT